MGPYVSLLLGLAVLASNGPHNGHSARLPLETERGVDTSADAGGQTYDLSIDDAVALAQQRSFKTARAERTLSQNELRYANAKSQYLPKLTTSVGVQPAGPQPCVERQHLRLSGVQPRPVPGHCERRSVDAH